MASPFSIFRKHQRVMMAVLGVAAMIAFVFLDPIKSLVATRRNNDRILATTDAGPIHASDVAQMQHSRNLANNFVSEALREATGMPRQGVFGDTNNEQELIKSMLLVRRAEQLGIVLSDDYIKEIIRKITEDKVTNPQLVNIARELEATPAQIYDAIRTQLLARQVTGMFLGGVQQTTPAQRWEYFLRTQRKATVEVLPVAAADFVKDVPDPSDATLAEFFEQYKNNLPVPGSPVPGFKAPARAKVQYLQAEYAKFNDPAAITDKQIEDNYKSKRDLEYQYVRRPSFSLSDSLKPKEAEKPAAEQPAAEKSDAEKPAAEDKSKSSDASPPANDTDTPAKSETTEPAKTPAPEAKPPAPDNKPQPDAAKPKENESSALEVLRASFDEFVELCQAEEAAKGAADAQPATPPADTPKADEKPADETPADKNADEKPAGDKPADEKPAAGEKPDAKMPDFGTPAKRDDDVALIPPRGEGGIAPAVEVPGPMLEMLMPSSIDGLVYTPLWKVSETIRTELARSAAAQKMNEALEKVRTQMSNYSRARARWESYKGEESTATEPKPLDLAALAKANGLNFVETPLATEREMAELPDIGKSIVVIGMQGAPFAAVVFQRLELFQTETSMDLPGNQYVFWKIESVPAKVPSLEDPATKADVVKAWKLIKAREPALKRAKALAEQATKEKKPLKDAFPGQGVLETKPFSWLTGGGIPGTMQQTPPRLSEVTNVVDPGDAFMREVFGLRTGDVGVAFNNPQTIAYVVQASGFQPPIAMLESQFVIDSFKTFDDVAAPEREQQFLAWLAELEREAGVSWAAQPEGAPTNEGE